ncbi:MAG: PD-(D/E)XK nuclease family protein, partial [Thermoleophilia bacterium]|nr:PD-(D/E)XK nuclease family protein [Thermoleophilia bacterium]
MPFDAVQILDLQRARVRRFPVVFVLGLVEGEFPAGRRTTSLLGGEQQARLNAVAGAPLLREPAGQEAALFLAAVSRSWQLLYLSTREADDEGTPEVPSYLWEQARATLGRGKELYRRRTLSEVVYTPAAAPTWRHYLRACTAHGCEPGPDVARVLPKPRIAPWRRIAGPLRHPQVLAHLQNTNVFSPSVVESYLQCPFIWFMERAVGVSDLENEIDSRTVGGILHRILSATYRDLGARSLLPLQPQGVEPACQLAEAHLERELKA